MTTGPTIKVENLSKLYRIGMAEQRSETLVGSVAGFLRSPWQNFKKLRSLSAVTVADGDSDDVIWALKDLSFSVEEGEVLGVIGANGAGKSTLLKLLAGITEPSSGRAVISGRVASLLEVGTGFHPDLSGRENVYLNGTILGMRKVEVDKKFDEIVGFSGVEKFIDTPVKRYSSGMAVRLAFAVAAHLDPEILLIDEVLAVGDASFQKKCLGKMDELAGSGRTVVFVSHNLAAVRALCSEAVLLQDGCLAFNGPVDQAIHTYHQSIEDRETQYAPISGDLRVSHLLLTDSNRLDFASNEEFVLGFRIRIPKELVGFSARLSMRNSENQLVVHSRSGDSDVQEPLIPGSYDCRVHFPILWLTPGRYEFQVKVLADSRDGEKLRAVSDSFEISVTNAGLERFELPGLLTPETHWDVRAVKGMQQ